MLFILLVLGFLAAAIICVYGMIKNAVMYIGGALLLTIFLLLILVLSTSPMANKLL